MKLNLFLPILFITILFFSCQNDNPPMNIIEAGVSKSLAEQRKANISDVGYELIFIIPEQLTDPIQGTNMISLDLKNTDSDLVIDFKNTSDVNAEIIVNKNKVTPRLEKEHIIIPKEYLEVGLNVIAIPFIAGEKALNRNEDFLYTLFVPDNARSAFPCFDQPNIKAKYLLTLSVPNGWEICTNYDLMNQEEKDGFQYYVFEETPPIPTYLFAFAAGKFQKITEIVGGREMTLYHRETNESKIKNNAFTVLDLHAKSLDWLEEYTGIPYPFKKFDFVLIPAFQFGGMEHPGAIFYKQRSLFLDENATVNQKMSRNSLIAHETAHMWFGDLVTMDWFDDVWLKEVFANFMAAKMVNPNFPEINHDLRFLARHQPTAYGEDRTEGTHPIQQQLDNLDQASLMYGRIIYQKAPVVMNQLEEMMGKQKFREGLQEYLKTFSFGNATWDDLIAIMDKRIDLDLKNWSQAWVKESGMPHLQADLQSKNGKITDYNLAIKNTTSGGSIWQQKASLVFSKNNKIERKLLTIKDKEMKVEALIGNDEPDFILPNASSNGYGYFEIDENSRDYLLENIHTIEDDVVKYAAWQSLWESMLRGKVKPQVLMQTIVKGLPHEKETIGLSARLGYLRTAYWGFFSEEEQRQLFPNLAKETWDMIGKTSDRNFKKSFYDTFVSIAQAGSKDEFLMYELWKKERTIDGLKLSENDRTTLAYELAVRNFKNTHDKKTSKDILKEQLENISNPDRQAAMKFVMPVFSEESTVRDEFFESLRSKENRQKEPWVQTAMQYLHHPLNAQQSEKYILPSLELVREIQKTNGIFFPKRWTATILNGHRSPEAAAIVKQFVTGLSDDYPVKLKNKILQAADMLERKANIND